MIKHLTDLEAVRVYLIRVGAEARSLRTAVVKETKGKYWKDLAVIKFSALGDINCPTAEHSPTPNEQAEIKRAWAEAEWPEIKKLHSIINPPEMIANAAKENVFEFRGEDGQIIMVQVRIEPKDGDKNYIPWTYWSDDQWRNCEPDGPLPLYNAHLLKDASTVFIHEGAKAAQRVQWMIDGETPAARDALKKHPWGREIIGAVHLGWIGGAMSPHRTDWSVLRRNGITRAYIVGDNDAAGRDAIPAISERIKITAFFVQFTNEFPTSFDLGDPFPAKMFGGEEQAYYDGPTFRECVHPATWATDLVQMGPGRPTAVLRDSFKRLWSYVEEVDQFVCNDFPEIMRSGDVLNKMLARYSHVSNTAGLILKTLTERSAKICYRPDQLGHIVTFHGTSAINLHIPSNIRPQAGDPKPWLDFMDYMFVKERERYEALRWCATLIARPDIRMSYGLLLISEKQGIGKTTLGSYILAPLVGVHNVSFPGEQDIVSPFNQWVAHKRLAIVSEIYSGQSWKAYHALKSIITDKNIDVNRKYMPQYSIENWCHIFASSNSMRALKMENDDRRWFYPEMTEMPWPNSYFVEFRRWIEQGGLQKIAYWAKNFKEYVLPAEKAPMTDRKLEMIEGSRSEAQSEAAAVATTLAEFDEPKTVLIKDVVAWCKAHSQVRVYDSDYEIRRAMLDAGAFCWKERIKAGGRLQYAIINGSMMDEAKRVDDLKEAIDMIRAGLVRVQDIMEREM